MNQFSLLGAKRFAPLFWTQFLGAFNDNAFKNALVIMIAFHATQSAGHNATQMVILSGGIFILPFFLFSAIAGQLADRYEKTLLIRRIKLAEVMIMVLAGLGLSMGELPFLLVVLFLMGSQSTLFGPLKYGILPQHLGEGELTGGNGMIQMGTFIAILLGTILGGVLVAIPQIGTALISVIVVTVAIAGWLVSRLIPIARAVDTTLVVRWNILVETLRIMRYARERRDVFLAIIAIAWFWFIGATLLSLVPSFGKHVLGGNEHVVTLLLTLFSVGIGLGSVSCEKLSKGRIEPGLVPFGAIGITLFSLDLYFAGAGFSIPERSDQLLAATEFIAAQGSWRIMLDLTGIAMFGGFYIVPLYAEVQSRSAPERRSRIIAAMNVLNAMFMVLSAVVTFFLIDAGFTIPQLLLVLAGLNVVVVTLIFTRLPEFPRRFLLWLGLGTLPEP
ncbi:MAG: MFS transporter [Gammaproteobacteria bacterium]|nr:MFS transporter [Gammaproteobacteria bacterium]